MNRFAEFMKQNKKGIYALAERNAEYNAKGQVVLKEDDPWRSENEWDAHYKELMINARDTSQGSMVR